MIIIFKKCKCCGLDLDTSLFHKHKGRKLGVTDCCKVCRNNLIVEKRYNLCEGCLQQMKIDQDNSCAICKNKFELLAVDHCHTTGKNRGLLCNNCNNGLGRFKDNIEYLENSIKYLKNYEK